ncbi:MAG: YggT family protein [Chloroflexota bacterium]
MARYSPEPNDDETARREAETRLYQPVQQIPAAEPTEVEPVPPTYTNVNVMPAGARPANERAVAAARCNAVLMWLFGLIEALIAIRFILKAVAANAGSPFAALIYGITDPLVGPFIGVLATPAIGPAVIELPALLAILIYFLISLLLTRLIRILFIDHSVGS